MIAELLLLIGGGMLMLMQPRGSSPPSPARWHVDCARLAHLPHYQALKCRVLRAMVAEWSNDGGVTLDDAAALLAISYKEGGWNLRAVSPVGAPDDAGGRAWGTFQFLKDTLAGLGFDIDDVAPRRDQNGAVSAAELDRAARGSAEVALAYLRQRRAWTQGRTYLDAVRSMWPGDPWAQAREYFVAWNAGPGRRWADIRQVAPSRVPGTLGYVHFTVSHKFEVLNDMRRALNLPELPPGEGLM